MEKLDTPQFCSNCTTPLKRQVIDSNIFYYCQKCRRMSSAIFLARNQKVNRYQGQRPSTTE